MYVQISLRVSDPNITELQLPIFQYEIAGQKIYSGSSFASCAAFFFFLYKNRLCRKVPNWVKHTNFRGQSRLLNTKYTDFVIYMCTIAKSG